MNRTITHYALEGTDRLGKDTLVRNILKKRGYHHVVHYSKPIECELYPGPDKLKSYQAESFAAGFRLMSRSEIPIIFNRFHLGEVVYSPLYRKYSGDYVYDMEIAYGAGQMSHVKLVLLTTSDWSLIIDDGNSHDFSRREEEQEAFKSAFARSKIKNKIIMDVARPEGGWKIPEEIAAEVIE